MAIVHEFSMPAVLRWLLRESPTGTLVVRRPGTHTILGTLLVEGRHARASSSSLRERAPGESAASQLVEDVAGFFDLRRAEVVFDDGASAVDSGTRVPLAHLLVEGLRRATVPRLELWAGALDEPLAVVGSPTKALDGASLDEAEAGFVERLSGRSAISDLLRESSLERSRALALLVALRYAGALATATPGASDWLGERDPFAPPAPESGVAPGLDEAAHFCFLIDQKLGALEAGANHYALLEVERRASPEAIKASYRELAKLYHPDRHGRLASADPGVKLSLDRLFQALSQAFATLSDPREREAYDVGLAAALQRAGRAAPPQRTPRPTRPEGQAPAAPQPIARATWPPPTAADPGPHLEGSQLASLGAHFLDEGDLERAVHAYRKGIAANANDPACHAGLGRALVAAEGLSPQAESALRKAISLDGCSVDLVVEVATIFADHGRGDDARILMTRALRLDPSDERARNALGVDERIGRDGVAGLLDRLFKR